MDSYEATRTVFSRIQGIDAENAQKIMGYLLIQDLTEKDLIRLAFGPETLLQSLIFKAKVHLGLSSSPTSPSPLNPISRPINPNPFSQTSPRMKNGFDFPRNPLSGFPNNSMSPKSSPLLSYENIRAGSFPLPPLSPHNNGGDNIRAGSFPLSPFSRHGGDNNCNYNEHVDEFFPFQNDSAKNELGYGAPNWARSGDTAETHLHRRSYSASEVCLESEDPGFGTGFKPCLYFARGFCKNGSNCKFSHGGFADFVDNSGPIVGSPSKFDGFDETMRMKAIQQQRVASKYISFLLQQGNDPQRVAMMVEEELHKFGRGRLERNDFLAMGLAEKANSASRQIYLTFPAESTFKDEDVSEYFSIFGPVQDVRIPHQQKRMFGFVTFVHPDTVRMILARGNPHFICDSRVLVKPYKEKGKLLDKRQQHQQQLEMGDFSPCSSPSGLDSREPYDVHPGARMYNTQELMLRRKLEEQAELQQAIELQGRRLMNLQLPDFKNDRIYHHHRSLSVGAPVSFLTQPLTQINQDVSLPSDGIDQEVTEDNGGSTSVTISSTAAAAHQGELNAACIYSNGGANIKEESSNPQEGVLRESCSGHFLPDSLFASPTKSAGHHPSAFSSSLAEADKKNAVPIATSSENNSSLPTTSTNEMASH